MYLGWEAVVDNVKTEVFEGNLAFRTIRVSQGKHDVLYRYNPIIFMIGGLVSLLFIGISLRLVKYTKVLV